MSQVTTHILDTSLGKPAAGVHVRLEMPGKKGDWVTIAEGTTNADGRIPHLLPDDNPLQTGVYRLMFEVAAYFNSSGRKHFYPFVDITFEVTDASHYHVPLLLNPFGYSTYRGS